MRCRMLLCYSSNNGHQQLHEHGSGAIKVDLDGAETMIVIIIPSDVATKINKHFMFAMMVTGRSNS